MHIIDSQMADFLNNKRNMKHEVDRALFLNNMTEEDILYVKCGNSKMSRERFLELADKDYDSRYFKECVNYLMVIVCKNAVMFYYHPGCVIDCITLTAEEDEDFEVVF